MDLNKKILVTGGTGFVGSYLLQGLLAYGFRHITAIRRHNSRHDLVREFESKVRWLTGDILDVPFLEDAMDGMDQVYHCAALVSFFPKERKTMLEINETGTANVVNVALAKKVEKVVYVSSIAALGRNKSGEMIDEQFKWTNSKYDTYYAISKYLAEMQVWRAVEEGLKAAIVNPSMIFGSGYWKSGTCRIFSTYSKNFPFYPAGGTGVVDVRDVARFMIELMNSDISRQRFILNGANKTYQELFCQISEAFGNKKPSVKMAPLIQQIAWRVLSLHSWFTGKPPLMSRETAQTTAHTFFYDNSKSLSAFPFMYTPLEQTIMETVNQFKESQERGFDAVQLPV